MIESVNSPSQQLNFAPDKIPPGTGEFYNSAKFAQALCTTLSTLVSQDNSAHARSSRALDESITGQG